MLNYINIQALDTLQCAEPLIELGVKATRFKLRERSSPLLSVDFGFLAKYTRYPFGLLLPQNITERILTEQLDKLGVKVFRQHKVIGMKRHGQNGDVVDVSFENSHVISARYVVGADGARSTVRTAELPVMWFNHSAVRFANWPVLGLQILMVSRRRIPIISHKWFSPT